MERSVVRLSPTALSSTSCSCACASVTKLCNLVSAKGRWSSTNGKVTVGWAMHHILRGSCYGLESMRQRDEILGRRCYDKTIITWIVPNVCPLRTVHGILPPKSAKYYVVTYWLTHLIIGLGRCVARCGQWCNEDIHFVCSVTRSSAVRSLWGAMGTRSDPGLWSFGWHCLALSYIMFVARL